MLGTALSPLPASRTEHEDRLYAEVTEQQETTTAADHKQQRRKAERQCKRNQPRGWRACLSKRELRICIYSIEGGSMSLRAF